MMEIGIVGGLDLGIGISDPADGEIANGVLDGRAGLEGHTDAEAIEIDTGNLTLIARVVALLLDN